MWKAKQRGRRDACGTFSVSPASSGRRAAAKMAAMQVVSQVIGMKKTNLRLLRAEQTGLKKVPFGSCPISGETVYTLFRRNYEGIP